MRNEIMVAAPSDAEIIDPRFALLERAAGFALDGTRYRRAQAVGTPDDDARLIAEHMLVEAARIQAMPRRQLGLDALAVLRAHRWPGNVRELKHVIERALVVADGALISADHLVINHRRLGGGGLRGAATFGEIKIPADGKRLRDVEKEALELTLQLTNYNQSAAARILCISRPTLARKLRAYGLAKDSVG